jgi:predicted metalloprotease with PDZ domain
MWRVWTKRQTQGQTIREVYATVPEDNASLGLSLQWMPLTSTEDVWHILDVTPNSPADVAGLLPYGDYVIGSPEGIVRGESGLGELVEDVRSRRYSEDALFLC